jgi:hypothetical protein
VLSIKAQRSSMAVLDRIDVVLMGFTLCSGTRLSAFSRFAPVMALRKASLSSSVMLRDCAMVKRKH